jgi:NAD(P)-dependent dehydrogenase (short-subunit alcohol dehydrogenase family)
MKVAGSIALVTGANRGLGLAFAKALVKMGAAKVYAAARNPEAITLKGETGRHQRRRRRRCGARGRGREPARQQCRHRKAWRLFRRRGDRGRARAV